MDYTALFISQIGDPFRIVLLLGLLLTMRNTRATTGTVVPALAGVVFVAALIPMTMTRDQPFVPQALMGLVTNGLILSVLLGAQRVAERLMK